MLQYIYFLEKSKEIFNFVIMPLAWVFLLVFFSVGLQRLLNGGNLLHRFGEVVMLLIRSTNVGRLWGLLAMICHHDQSNCVLMSKLRKLWQKGAYKL